MTKRPDDAEFRDKLLSGDIEAFRQFFRHRSPEVLALCRAILRNSQDAEDVTADVFFEVWMRRNKFDPTRGDLRSYVLMLARSRAIDLYRSKKKQQTRLTKILPADELQESDVHSPQVDLAQKELNGLAKSAIAQLNEAEKTAIELAFYEGLTHVQISNRLDSPLGTVKSHIRRGLAKLKLKLQEWGS